MSKQHEHSRQIAAAAKDALTPLGFRRKGRSRVWLADRGFWLSVVEFQPSGFSKGSYFNVAAHWLWGLPPYFLGFDYCERFGEFVAFLDPDSFEPVARQIAHNAAEASIHYQLQFVTVAATAHHLADHLKRTLAQWPYLRSRPGGWSEFNAGVAAGLVGDSTAARRLFAAAQEGLNERRAAIQSLSDAAADTTQFRQIVQQSVNEQRAFLQLSPMPTIIVGQ